MARSLSLFGAPSFLYNESMKKFSQNTNIVNFRNFIRWEPLWVTLSLMMPFFGPFLLVFVFFVTFFFHNTINGFLFSGSLLSFISCFLSCLSYFQVYPWRRHPSIILFFICFLGLIFSIMIFVYAMPYYTPRYLSDDESYDNSRSCVLCSFFTQFIVFSRELWVLMLSFDLLTSVSNPFSSYQLQLKRYSLVVWLFSFGISSLLVTHGKDKCVGKFLNNGMCWLNSDEIGFKDICLWNYFLTWTLIFYVIGILILLYVLVSIKKKNIGKTFATRYAYVADTVRIIVSYFCYGLVLCFFYSLVSHEHFDKKIYKSIFAYLTACRGYFDSLVWFSAHGFVTKNENILTNLSLFKKIIWEHGPESKLDKLNKHNLKKNDSESTLGSIFSQSETGRTSMAIHDVIHANKNASQPQPGDAQNAPSNDANDVSGSSPSHSIEDDDDEDFNNLRFKNIFNITEFYYQFIQSYRDTIRILFSCMRKPFRTAEQPAAAKEFSNLSQSNLSKLNGDLIPDSISASPIHLESNVPFSSNPERSTSKSSNAPESTVGNIHFNNKSNSFSDSSSMSYSLRSLSSSYRSEYDNNNFHYMKSIMYQDDNAGFFESTEYDQQNLDEEEKDGDVEDNLNTSDNPNGKKKKSKRKKKLTKVVQNAINDMDLSPQLNLHLRKEVLSLVTQGIKESVLRWKVKKTSIKKKFVSTNNLFAYMDEENDIESSPDKTEAKDEPEAYFPSYPSNHSLKHYIDEEKEKEKEKEKEFNFAKSLNFSFNQSYFFNRDAKENNNNNFNDSYSQGSKIISTAVYGLLSAIGTHIPGEYGVDNLGRHLILPSALSSAHLTPSVSSAQLQHVSSVNKLMELHDIAKNPNINKDNLDHSVAFEASMANRLDPSILPPPPPAEVVFKIADTQLFRDFRPSTFSKLREMVGFNDEEYLDIISQPTQERLSEGRSGAFFFICGKGELVVKTVESHEAKTLLNILDDYYTYLIERPDSLLVRFLGLHSIQMYGNEFTFVVMKNVFPTGLNLSKKYDIKGSWVNRSGNSKPDPNSNKLSRCRICNKEYYEGSEENCPLLVGPHEASLTLKDNDSTSRIRLHHVYARHLFEVICSDSKFLSDLGLMDYSLLIGIQYGKFEIHQEENNDGNGGTLFSPMIPMQNFSENKESSSVYSPYNSPFSLFSPLKPNPNEDTNKASLSSVADLYSAREPPSHFPAALVIAPQYYHFGVIDILQSWTWKKRLERLIKVYLCSQDANGISCVEPEFYRDRYQEKMLRIIQPINPNQNLENIKKIN